MTAKEICQKHNIDSFHTMILGNCIGHFMDKGLDDLEILTICEELLKCRQIIEKEKENIEKFFNNISKELNKEG